MIEVEAFSKLYGDLRAVQSLSFSVQSGEVVGLVGPNGAGKTTTLRSIAGIVRPTEGTIRVAGHDLAREPVAAKRELAFIPDEPQLFEYLTVMEHLRLTGRIYQVAAVESRARALIDALQLSDKTDALPAELSRGMKQKVTIACALLHDPSALLFDEPLTGLDPLGIRQMKATIVSRAADGAAVVLSSHLLHLVEEVCTRILILHRGVGIADGTLAQLTAQARAAGAGSTLEQIFLDATAREHH